MLFLRRRRAVHVGAKELPEAAALALGQKLGGLSQPFPLPPRPPFQLFVCEPPEFVSGVFLFNPRLELLQMYFGTGFAVLS